MRIHQHPPWWFRLIGDRIAQDKRGPWAMLRLAERLGLLKAAAWFPLADERILMPLDWPQIYRHDQLRRFEPDAIASFAAAIDSFHTKAIMLDCGADVGLYSRIMMQRTANLRQVILFEPNPHSFAMLQKNFDDVRVPARPINAGVSNFAGFAVMDNPSSNLNPHAGFIRPAESGIPVMTIDSLDLPPDAPIAMKLDVEGEELRALQGATQTMRRTPEFVMQIEAAKGVFVRTGQEPIEILRFLNQLRPCRFTVCEEITQTVHRDIDLDRPLFEQLPERYLVVDVIARSAT